MNPFPQRRRPLDERRELPSLFFVLFAVFRYGVLLYIALKLGVPVIKALTTR